MTEKIHNDITETILGARTLKLPDQISKTFSIKMKEDVHVGMSKPKKHANKVGRLT